MRARSKIHQEKPKIYNIIVEPDTYPLVLVNEMFVPLQGLQSSKRTLIYAFAYFLVTITEVLYLEERLDTSFVSTQF